MKHIKILLSILFSSILNFGIFILAYNKFVFPYLHEEQRVENAPYIFIYIAPSFIVIAIISLLIYKKFRVYS
jgi:hypothetical protein